MAPTAIVSEDDVSRCGSEIYPGSASNGISDGGALAPLSRWRDHASTEKPWLIISGTFAAVSAWVVLSGVTNGEW
jgi:hypothetical protein